MAPYERSLAEDPVNAPLAARRPPRGKANLLGGLPPAASRFEMRRFDCSFIDWSDGPLNFVILIIGFVVCSLALWLEAGLDSTLWVPLTMLPALPLLRALKGLLIGLQYRNLAAEGWLIEKGERRND